MARGFVPSIGRVRCPAGFQHERGELLRGRRERRRTRTNKEKGDRDDGTAAGTCTPGAAGENLGWRLLSRFHCNRSGLDGAKNKLRSGPRSPSAAGGTLASVLEFLGKQRWSTGFVQQPPPKQWVSQRGLASLRRCVSSVLLRLLSLLANFAPGQASYWPERCTIVRQPPCHLPKLLADSSPAGRRTSYPARPRQKRRRRRMRSSAICAPSYCRNPRKQD